MKKITRHLSKCLVAGIVALLPIAGTVLTVVYFETMLAESWLADQPYYFPGLGLLAAVVVIYGIGFVVSTFLGRWIWARVDRLLDSLPALGGLYQTLKQILGYGEGQDAMFQRVVMIRSRDVDAEELALVTNELRDDDGAVRYVVFVPGSPNPTAGRLLLMAESALRPIDMPVSDAMRALVSVGKTSLGENPRSDPSGSGA